MKGHKTGGGSRKGKPNKMPSKALLAQAAAQATVGTELTPLAYMLDVMRNGSDPELRLKAATAAAPYYHGKIATILEHTGPGGGPIKGEISFVEWRVVRPKS